MSGLGQSLPKWALRATSAYPPTAAVQRTFRHFGFVPVRDSCTRQTAPLFDQLVCCEPVHSDLVNRTHSVPSLIQSSLTMLHRPAALDVSFSQDAYDRSTHSDRGSAVDDNCLPSHALRAAIGDGHLCDVIGASRSS